MEEKRKRENMIAGLVGAFLGSLLGVASIIVVGQMGYIASVCGLVMAVCTLKGYELLGGVLSRKGAVISSLLTLIMTYVAHQANLAISISAEVNVNFFQVFCSMNRLLREGFLNKGAYWGSLFMLYLFVLLGAVPMLLKVVRGNGKEYVPESVSDTLNKEENQKFTVYYAENSWMRSLRLSLSLGMLLILPGILFVIFSSAVNPDWIHILWLVLGGILVPFSLIFFILWRLRPADAFRWVFVRSGDNLWRIDLSALNTNDTYRFTKSKISLNNIRWTKLSYEEQERARQSIRRAIQVLSNEKVMEGSALSRAVRYLPNPQVVKEDKWSWTISYGDKGGIEGKTRRSKMLVAKAYPGFSPVAGIESPTQAAPAFWSFLILTALLSLGLAAGSWILNLPTEETSKPHKYEEYSADSYVSYEQGDMTFQIDGRWKQDKYDQFFDPETGVIYTITVVPDATEGTAVNTLIDPLGQYRMDPNFKGFAFSSQNTDGTLVEMTAKDGLIYRHELITFEFKDESALYTGAALSDSGTLVVVEASQSLIKQKKQVKNAILDLFYRMHPAD